MKRKVMILALIFLLFLPAISFTGDLEVTDVELEWKKVWESSHSYSARIRVKNPTDRVHLFSGYLIFYDRAGYKIQQSIFRGRARPGKTVTVTTGGVLFGDDYEDIYGHEAVITGPLTPP